MRFFSKNFYYHLIGLIYLIHAYIKYGLLDYEKKSRPISPEEIDKNLEYNVRVINNFEKNFLELTGKVFDYSEKDILEIGPGHDLGTGLIFMINGVRSYVGVDRFTLITRNTNFYRSVTSFFGKDNDERISGLREKIVDCLRRDSKTIDLSNFKYLNCSAEELSGVLSGKKFDFIFSNAVLEHVECPEKVFQEFFELLKDDGVMFHEIDFQAHVAFLRNRDPLNILKFNKSLYKFFRHDGYLNRYRITDFARAAKVAGFTNMEILTINHLTIEEVNKIKPYLSYDFKHRNTEELRVLSAVLVARKR